MQLDKPRLKCEPVQQFRKGRNGNPQPKVSQSAGEQSAEFLEGRTMAKGNSRQESAMTQTPCWGGMLTGLARVRRAAKQNEHLK